MKQVVVHKIDITRSGELKNFQVRIPNQTKKIIGIETGLRMVNDLPASYIPDYGRFGVRTNRLMGELRLQALDNCNFFYSKEVFDKDRNISNDSIEIWQPPAQERRIAGDISIVEFVHGYRLEEDPVLISGNTVIAGTFKDTIGKLLQIIPDYKVMLYIWCSDKC